MSKGLSGIQPNTPGEPEKRRGVFTARYEGACGICSHYVEPGDECHYVDDEVCHLGCE